MAKRLKYKYHKDFALPENPTEYIIVFGSNLGGYHGRGMAVIAKTFYGAEQGVGVGITGRCYAIPTKDRFIRTLDTHEIKKYVDDFKKYTNEHPELKFWVTGVGTGLAKYKPYNIAPLFIGSGVNCNFPKQWKKYLK